MTSWWHDNARRGIQMRIEFNMARAHLLNILELFTSGGNEEEYFNEMSEKISSFVAWVENESPIA